MAPKKEQRGVAPSVHAAHDNPEAHGVTQGMASRISRDSAVTRAAATLFLEQGVDPVKMTDIADVANVGVATIYRHFGTKTNVIVATATLLWHEFGESFAELAAGEGECSTGLESVRGLFSVFAKEYLEHPEFITFLDSVDHSVLVDGADEGLLKSYDAELASFYGIFEAAFKAGVDDGSIRSDVNFQLFYITTNHALMGVAQKLLRGEVVPSDDFTHGDSEIALIIDMAIAYLKAR